ncbi:MAG: asparagine synthase (glutamine-hydrolyzing) [bacterium]
MSAICGIIADQSKDSIRQILASMLAAMSFRGPDGTGIYGEDTIGLGASIQRTVGDSTQPVTNETGEVIAVCDGEIYNHQEIGSWLLGRDHKLSRESDTEIIPHLYEERGDSFAAELNGIFTIALYDAHRRRLLLIRDHLGSRSVFYSEKDSKFIFATTIRALLGTGIIGRKLSLQAVDLYFAGTCVPHPYTMFEEIKSVRPGYAVIWENGSCREHEYWSLNTIVEDYSTSEGDFQDQIRELALNAIKIRMIGEKPFGAILSGGVDSSLISSVLAQAAPDKKLQTFSIGFEEESFDDSSLQEIMLSRYNLLKNKATLRAEMAADLLQKVIRNSDYPINNASAMGTYLCMEQVKSAGLETVFDGEAADEIFCGGGGVVGENLVELFERIPKLFRTVIFGPWAGSLQINRTGKVAAFRRLCQRVCMSPIDRMLTWLPAFDRETRRQLLTGEYQRLVGNWDELEPGKFYLRRAQFKDGINLYQYGACKTYLPNDLLFKNERMSAAHGVVNRTPFIDYRLVELAFRIPAKYKLTGYTPQSAEKKLIYRKAIQGLIPEEIRLHKKIRGFSQPTALWMRKELKDFILDIVLGKQCIGRGILNPVFIRKIVEEHMSGVGDRDRLIWGIVTFELWMREFVD